MKKLKPCKDCGKETWLGYGTSPDYYIVQNSIWEEANKVSVDSCIPDQILSNFLCIGCLEKRLGRNLVLEDFIQCDINDTNPYIQEYYYKRFLTKTEIGVLNLYKDLAAKIRGHVMVSFSEQSPCFKKSCENCMHSRPNQFGIVSVYPYFCKTDSGGLMANQKIKKTEIIEIGMKCPGWNINPLLGVFEDKSIIRSI